MIRSASCRCPEAVKTCVCVCFCSQSSEKINSEPKCQRVQAQVQHSGQFSVLHRDAATSQCWFLLLTTCFCFCSCLSLFQCLLQPKPANTPTPPRPQGQPSPSIVVQQPPAMYGQPVCFPQMYPLTPVSPGVQVREPTRTPITSSISPDRHEFATFIKTVN